MGKRIKKILFVVGMRKSGTTITRELLLQHINVKGVLFEPHELIFACKTIKHARYKHSQYHHDVINRFKTHEFDKYFGAKIALNAELYSMNWKWLPSTFRYAKFIFPIRNLNDNFNSWYKRDKKTLKGVIPKEIYEYFYHKINNSFKEFIKKHKTRGVIVNYENLVKNADKEFIKVWETLKLKPHKGLNTLMHKPKNWTIT